MRIARRKYDKSSAYRSGAIVKCRRGKIWKNLKEDSQIVSEVYDQNTIKSVFESNPELANVGTPEQYSHYLDSIFPSSKVKGIYYHTSPNKIDKFRETMFGTYFAYSPIEHGYGGVINSALLNVKNPLVKPKPTDSPEEKAAYNREYRNYNNPSSPYDASIEGSTVTKEGTQIRVKKPEQIHVLGSKEDVEKFKQYVESELTEAKKETLHQWFKRRGAKGKSSGWIDCNAPDGEGGYKPCGRQKGEKRSEYPACRKTPKACKDPGKGTKWGKKSK